MKNKNLLVSYLGLFTSLGTVLCCALPTLLVILGFGASFAGLVGVFPQITWLSEHKGLVFAVSGVLILSSLMMLYLNRNAPCPIDPDEARACKVSRKVSLIVVSISGLLWIMGFFFAYLAVKVFF